MAVDRLGNTIATGQVYALAGTVRFVDGDNVVVVVGERGEQVIRCKAADIVKVDDTTGGGGGAPTTAEYVLKSAAGGLSNGRVLTNSLSIEWNWTVSGYVAAEIPASYLAALGSLVFQPLSSILTYIATTGVDSNMIVDGSIATVDLGNDVVTDAKLRNSAACSVVGRSANSTGDPADIPSSTNGHVVRRASDVVGWGTLLAASFADNTIALGRLADLSGPGYVGRGSTGSGAPALIGVATPTRVTPSSGDVFHKFNGSTGAIERCSWQEMLDEIAAYLGVTPP